jgi:protein SCO1/2
VTPTRAPALADAPRGDYFPNVVLRTHDNQPLRFYDDLLRGKVVLINFLYVTCGDICPLMTANLVRVQAALGVRLGREVFMYSITLDPQTDTPEALKQYAAGYGVKPGWYFLTGQDEEIQRLRRTLGLYDRDPRIDADKTQHTGLLIYGNEVTGRWGAIPALLAPERIVRAVLRVLGPQPAVLTPRKP